MEAVAARHLHRRRVLRLTEDADQLVIGQEVEAGEGRPFGLQVVGQILLHPFQLGVRLRPLLEKVGVIAEREDVRRVADAGERLPPQPVDAGEALALGGELAVDVVRLEDRLEVHPVALREGDWG